MFVLMGCIYKLFMEHNDQILSCNWALTLLLQFPFKVRTVIVKCFFFPLAFFYRCIHVSPSTERGDETREELRMEDEDENGNKQDEKLIKDDDKDQKNENEHGNADEHTDCREEIELVTVL